MRFLMLGVLCCMLWGAGTMAPALADERSKLSKTRVKVPKGKKQKSVTKKKKLSQKQQKKLRGDAVRQLKKRGITPERYEEEAIGAARSGDVKLLELLLAAGVDPNTREKESNQGLLHLARTEEVVKLLLDTPGCDPEIKDKWGVTPLERACSANLTKARAMIEHGVDISPEKMKLGLLSCALLDDDVGIINYLLSVPGFDVNACNRDGHTTVRQVCDDDFGYRPVHTSQGTIKVNAEVRLRRLILLPGVDVNKPDADGNTPLHVLARHGDSYVERLKILLSAPGVDVNRRNNADITPLGLSRPGSTVDRLLTEAGGTR